MTIECYSQHLLNPFRGVMSVIRYPCAEAVSADAIEWKISVSNTETRFELAQPDRAMSTWYLALGD